MDRASIRKTVSVGVMLPVIALTAGCPVPLPTGYRESSRENLGEEVTSLLVAGESTREDVLLLLGEPDGAGPNDSWLTYGSIYSQGGVIFLLCGQGGCLGAGSEKMGYRRLIVTFDGFGVMTKHEFVDKDCWEGMFALGGTGGGQESRSAPCMQVNAPSGERIAPANGESTYASRQKPGSASVIAVRHQWKETLDQRAVTLQRQRSDLLPLARSGDVNAQYELSQLSENTKDRWYRVCVAAHGGHARSQQLMGASHLVGSFPNTAADSTKAYLWYALAARNGDSQAEQALPSLAKKMLPAHLEAAQAALKNWTPTPEDCAPEASDGAVR